MRVQGSDTHRWGMATLDLGLEEVRWPPGEPPDAAGDTETWPLPGADLGRNGDPELMMPPLLVPWPTQSPTCSAATIFLLKL